MPRVPLYDAPQQTASLVPSVGVRNAATEEMFSAGAKQMQQLGGALQRTGRQAAAISLDIQHEANTLRVQDAVNQAREAAQRLAYDKNSGYTQLKGADALNRPDGKPLADEYADRFRQEISTLGTSLGNDAQRAAFKEHADQMLSSFHGDAMRHEGEQFNRYAMSVREGTISNRVNDIGINYNNPDRINSAVEDIKAATYDLARQKGLSAVEGDVMVRDATSKAHRAALAAALQNNNPVYANDYMKRYSSEMNADDILAVNGVLTKHLDAAAASQAVQDVFRQASPKLDTPDADRAFNIILGTESNNRQLDSKGQPLTSSAGAIGIAQVMPAMGPAAAKLAGVEWDENRFKTDAEYNSSLGKALFQDALRRQGGDLEKAFAEYNLGGPKLDKATARAEKEGVPWTTYLPEETQNYVINNTTEYRQGGGRYTRPTLLEIKQQVQERVGSDNPERLNTALELAEKQFNDQTKAITQRQDEAVAAAMESLLSNGGGYASLSSDLRAAIPPEKVGSVIDFAKKLAAGEDTKTDWSLYYQLKSDASLLGATNLMAVRDKLNDSEFKELVNLQGEAKRGTSTTQLRSVKDTLDQYLIESGINPNPKADDTENAARVGRVWSAVEAGVRERETALGRKLSPDEMQKEIGRMMTTVEVNGWTSSSRNLPAVAVDATTDPVVVPSAERDLIKEALRATGKPITDENIARLYLRGKMGK